MAESDPRGSERPEDSEPSWKRLENLVTGMAQTVNNVAQEMSVMRQETGARMDLMRADMQAAVGAARQFTVEYGKRLQ